MFFGWFIHRTICWIYLFRIWQSELSFLSSKKTRSEKFQNKKEIPLLPPLSHLFNSPLPSNRRPSPPPRAGPREGQSLLFALFFFIVGSSSTFPPLPLFVLVSVSLEISSCIVQFYLQYEGDTTCQNGAFGGWVGASVCVSVCVWGDQCGSSNN